MSHKSIIFNKGLEQELKGIRLPFKAEIHNNVIDPQIGKSNGKRILNLICECPPFRSPNRAILDRAEEFDLILTHDEEILFKCRNAQKMLFGTTWIDPIGLQGIWNQKKFGVSFICGSKNKTAGHKLRHKIWARQNKIKIPSKFWASSRKPITNKGLVLPEAPSRKRVALFQQFHIAIENTMANNYFTEKLIDCFITKTIPIYWGCPNIGEYFDINGVLSGSSEDEIIYTCNVLQDNHYEIFKHVVDKNYELALQYVRPLGIRLQEKIMETLG